MSHSARIWLIDRLYPELSFEEFSQYAQNLVKLLNEEFSNTPEWIIKPKSVFLKDIQLSMENNETIHIKEIIVGDYKGLIINVPHKTKCFIEYVNWDSPALKSILAPDNKELLCVLEHTNENNNVVKIGDNRWIANRDWIKENPDWDFKKVVLDALPEYIIKADLNS